jgi:hypothetical protein
MTTHTSLRALAELRKLALSATPGPWIHHRESGPYTYRDEVWSDAPLKDGEGMGPVVDEINTKDDAAYIAAANPSTILSLLDEVERLREQNDTLEKACLLKDERTVVLRARLAQAEECIKPFAKAEVRGQSAYIVHDPEPHVDGRKVLHLIVSEDGFELINRARAALNKEGE